MMAIVNTSIIITTRNPETKVHLLSNDNLGIVPSPFKQHTILGDQNTVGPACGLIPFGSVNARIKTTGLKWNLGF
jgi:hypothetical protein